MKRHHSKYDSYFVRDGDDGVCRLCARKIPWKADGGTNCLRHHLEKTHPVEFQQLKSNDAPPAKTSKSPSEEIQKTDSQGHSQRQECEISEGANGVPTTHNVRCALGKKDPRGRLTVPCVPSGMYNVYSCAGFVKSSSPIDFSDLKVKLLTLEGHLKHEEEVNPSNGYFMIPVYNKGSYTLKVASPAGYYFEPDTIEIKIDGKTDACSKNKDLVFNLTGFSVRGTVDGAPAGLSLVLTQNGKQVDSTKTLEGGKYEMRAPPGKYEVSTGADASECIARRKATVEVKDSPVVVTPNLKISGYQLEIATKNMEHHPFTDAAMTLYATSFIDLPNVKCETSEGAHDVPTTHNVRCALGKTDPRGRLIVPCVTSGKHNLQPTHEDGATSIPFASIPLITHENNEEDTMIVKMLCGDVVPVKQVEGANFRMMLKNLKPEFKFQTVEHYVNLVLPSFRASLESKIMKDLKLATKVSVVVDCGATGMNGLDCAAIFAHWTNEATMEPTYALLKFQTFRNVTEIGPEFFDSIISKFEISGKIVAIIDENDSKLSDDTVPRMPNFEGILNKVPRILYSNHSDLISKQISMLLEYERLQQEYGWNSHYADMLNMEHANMEVLSETLKNPEKMSWNDHHDLLYIVHDQKAPEVLDNFFEKMKVKRNCQEMTPDDMAISAFIYKALKIVLETRSAIRDWIYPKAAIIIPMLRVLLNKSKKLDTSGPSSEALSMMKSELIEHLQNASNSCQNNNILKTATFLDSRFRDRFFLKSHKKFMIIKYQKFAEEYYNTILDVIKKEEEDSTEATAPEEQLEKEIAEYLQESPNPHSNPIKYWIKNNAKLPILKNLAAQFLSIPACEAMKAKEVYEFGDQIYPERHMNSIKEKFGYCAANMEIEKFAKNCLNLQ